jgi:RNA polymerase sigma factor (sigma-70 family)
MQNIAKDENKKIASKVRQKKQQNGDYKSEIDENGNPIWESDKSEGSYVNGELIWTDKPKWKKRQPVDIEDEIDEKGNPVRPEKQLLISNSVKGLSGDSQLQNDYSNKLIDWQEVVSILKKMNQKCQNILLLASEQYKYLEMSERLGIKLGTVESRLDRCRKRLYKELYG